MEREGFRWIILATVYLAMAAFAVAFHAVPPVLSLIIKDLGLSHAQGGLLMSVFAMPGIVVSILSGMLSDRYGIRRIGGICLSLMVLGCLMAAMSNSYGAMLIGRVITGIGGLGITVNLFRLLSLWFMGKEVGLAMGIFATSYPVGTLLSFNIFGFLGSKLGWRAPVWVSVGTGLLAAVLFFLNCREPRKEGESPQVPFNFHILVGIGLPMWLLAFSWMSFESVIISFLTFAPDYFRGKGVSLTIASALPALIMPAHIILQPMVGWILDRLGRKEYFIGIGGLLMAFLMIGMAGDYESYLFLLILFGIFSSLVPTSTFSFLPSLVSPLHLGLAFGILSSLANIGRVIAPYLVGFTRDYTGGYRSGFFLMAVLSLGVTLNIMLLALRCKKGASAGS